MNRFLWLCGAGLLALPLVRLRALGAGPATAAPGCQSGIPAPRIGRRRHARGQFVMTRDADSTIEPDAITNALSYFDDPYAAGVAAKVQILEETTVLGILQDQTGTQDQTVAADRSTITSHFLAAQLQLIDESGIEVQPVAQAFKQLQGPWSPFDGVTKRRRPPEKNGKSS